MPKESGKLVLFEGIGGCGKGTQVRLLAEKLQKDGLSVLVTFEHTRDTAIGSMIEDTIKGRLPKIDSNALQLLYTADRAEHTASVIKPALENNDVVILDRYYPSTVAYSPDDKKRYFLDANIGIFVRPDLVLVIDLDPEEAVRRINGRGDADIFDKVESLKRCRNGYLWCMENDVETEYVLIDGKGTPDEVHQRVVGEIAQRKLLSPAV